MILLKTHYLNLFNVFKKKIIFFSQMLTLILERELTLFFNTCTIGLIRCKSDIYMCMYILQRNPAEFSLNFHY
jgi:hypothetical protein